MRNFDVELGINARDMWYILYVDKFTSELHLVAYDSRIPCHCRVLCSSLGAWNVRTENVGMKFIDVSHSYYFGIVQLVLETRSNTYVNKTWILHHEINFQERPQNLILYGEQTRRWQRGIEAWQKILHLKAVVILLSFYYAFVLRFLALLHVDSFDWKPDNFPLCTLASLFTSAIIGSREFRLSVQTHYGVLK